MLEYEEINGISVPKNYEFTRQKNETNFRREGKICIDLTRSDHRKSERRIDAKNHIFPNALYFWMVQQSQQHLDMPKYFKCRYRCKSSKIPFRADRSIRNAKHSNQWNDPGAYNATKPSFRCDVIGFCSLEIPV